MLKEPVQQEWVSYPEAERPRFTASLMIAKIHHGFPRQRSKMGDDNVYSGFHKG